MGYIGSNPITQYFKEGTDSFIVPVPTSQSVFNLSRPVISISSIEVIVGNAYLPPLLTNYTVSGSTLNLQNAVSGVTVYVRYLTASNYSVQLSANSIPLNSLMASGPLTANAYLRADGSWALPGIPQNAQTGPYTLQASDNGFHISITTGGITVPAGVFTIGNTITIFNNSNVQQVITAAAGVSFLVPGSLPVTTRTLIQYGVCTLLCTDPNAFLLTGAGIAT